MWVQKVLDEFGYFRSAVPRSESVKLGLLSGFQQTRWGSFYSQTGRGLPHLLEVVHYVQPSL